jgi:hypothetical protein
MTRFYFHIHDPQGVIPDEEGAELPDIEAAKKEAEESAKELLKFMLRNNG